MNNLLDKEKQKKIIIILDNLVYDLTDFVDIHPGGPMVIQDSVDKDCDKLFLFLKKILSSSFAFLFFSSKPSGLVDPSYCRGKAFNNANLDLLW